MSSEFKIEKAVPVPPKKGGGRAPKYPYRDLEVGDSFFVPGIKTTGASDAGKRLGLKFTQRRVDGGMRVWRVE